MPPQVHLDPLNQILIHVDPNATPGEEYPHNESVAIHIPHSHSVENHTLNNSHSLSIRALKMWTMPPQTLLLTFLLTVLQTVQ